MNDYTRIGQLRTAAKHYWCAICATAIEQGTGYFSQEALYDDRWSTWRFCTLCHTDDVERYLTSWDGELLVDYAWDWAHDYRDTIEEAARLCDRLEAAAEREKQQYNERKEL